MGHSARLSGGANKFSQIMAEQNVHKQIFAKQVYLQSGGQLNKNLTKIICSFYIFFTKFWFIPKHFLSKQAELEICGKALKTPRETPEDNCSTVSMNTRRTPWLMNMNGISQIRKRLCLLHLTKIRNWVIAHWE